MYSDLLLAVLTSPDATPQPAIRAGVDLAKRLGGDLTLLAVQLDVPAVGNPLANALLDFDRLAVAETARSAAVGVEASAYARAAAGDADVRLETTVVSAAPFLQADAVARAARTRDLCLLPIGAKVAADRSLAEAVLFDSGRAIVVYPKELQIDAGRGLDVVVIAWDGSARAARAVSDALPALAQAKEVRVFVAVGEKPSVTVGIGQDLIRHLQAHGVRARLDERAVERSRIGDQLRDAVRVSGADLLVMGGFGHRRVRDLILGGATEAVLQDPPCPGLMSH